MSDAKRFGLEGVLILVDISMCQNDECPLRKQCYRYNAIPCEYMQSYAEFKPDEDGKCDHFWQITDQRTRNASE